MAAPFRRGVQKGMQASEPQGGPSICQHMGIEDLCKGDESDNEGPLVGNRSPKYPQGSPLIADGLPSECQLISFSSFCSSCQ